MTTSRSEGANANAGFMGDGWLKRDSDLGPWHLGLPKNALNVRFGQFELDLPFTQAKSTIYLSPYDIYVARTSLRLAGVRDHGITAGHGLHPTNIPLRFGIPQRGIEFGGTPNNGNFDWSVAVTNGSSNVGRYHDGVLQRTSTSACSQKFTLWSATLESRGRNAIQAAGTNRSSGPHFDPSSDFFVLLRQESAESGRSSSFRDLATIEEPFYRVGGDLRFKYRKLEMYGLGMFGHDDNHVVTPGAPPTIATAPAVKFSGGFAGANYWFYLWLIGTFHYDAVNSRVDFLNGTPASEHQTRNRFSPGFQVLVRANIKVVGEYQYTFGQPYTDPASGNILFFRPNAFQAGIDYVF